jgi:hypothetical protein
MNCAALEQQQQLLPPPLPLQRCPQQSLFQPQYLGFHIRLTLSPLSYIFCSLSQLPQLFLPIAYLVVTSTYEL